MRNLKKLLAVITVVALMATLFVIPASAAGLSDVADNQYESAISRLNALGIITGREDGKFYPDDTITRAEFAAVVIRSLGYGDAAAAAKGQTKFSDVKADFWAAGYINLASSLGIIKGRPDGTFGANDKVLYEEAVTMVVRGLGYEPAAMANGGYPSGYLVVAAQEDVTDDAAAVAGTQASRALVAKLVDNSLEVEMMGQVSYGTEIKYEKNGKFLLTDGLKLKEYDGTIEAVDVDDMTIKVKIDDVAAYGNKAASVQNYDVFETLSIIGIEDAKVTVWVKEISNADDLVYNIKLNSTIVYDYIDKVNGKDSDDPGYPGDDADITSIKFKNSAAEYDMYDSNDAGEAHNVAITENGVAWAGRNYLGTFAKAVVSEGKIMKLDVYAMTEGGLITAADEDVITYTKNDSEGRKVRGLDGADSLLVVVDGAIAQASDLAVDMVFDYYILSKDIVVVATSKIAEGELEKVYTGKVYIAGTKYDLDGSKYYSIDNGGEYDVWDEVVAGDALIGTDVVGYMTPSNMSKVRYLKGTGTSTTSDFWGVITKAYATDEDYIQVMRDVDGAEKKVTYKVDDQETGSAYTTLAALQGTIDTPAENIAGNGVFKFKINSDNEIVKMTAATWEDSDLDTAGVDAIFADVDDFDAGKDSVELTDTTGAGTAREFFVADTKFFNLEKAGAFDPELIKWADLEKMDVNAALRMQFNATDKDKPNVGLFVDGYETITASDKFFAFVTDKVRVDADNYELSVTLPDGSSATLTVDEDDDQDIGTKAFFKYEKTAVEGKIKVVAGSIKTKASGLTPVTSVYDVDGSSVQFAEGGNWSKFAGDVIVYEFNDNGDTYNLRDTTDIYDDKADGKVDPTADNQDGDNAWYYLDSNIIKGIIFEQ